MTLPTVQVAFYSEKEFDEISIMAFLAIEDGESLFITGKAGTGKTTLLDKIVKFNDNKPVSQRKNMVVLAPTGVAAVNAKGMTIHRFFGLTPLTYLPKFKNNSKRYNLDTQMQEVVRNLDILIIDEISMVRCDLLDAVDDILRYYRDDDKPFGGVQLVMFGDLYQLPPVTESDDEELLSICYNLSDQYYFFCSKALKKLHYRIIELEKIYRQDDPVFKGLLNRVRIGDVTLNDLQMLKSRYSEEIKLDVDSRVLTLTAYNRTAYGINQSMYSKLNGEEHKPYYANIDGTWRGKRYPADRELKLKVGARVMFLRNSSTGEYVNGTMGKVDALYDDCIDVSTDDGKLVRVCRTEWEQCEYKLDKKNKIVQRVVTATFKQFPLKLAWAVSIHKSQGLTFDNVVIDASKAFASGQVYVALSRCRTLKGIRLRSMLHLQDIIIDPVIGEYLKCVNDEGWVKLPAKFESVKYEKEPLVLDYVDAYQFNAIKNGSTSFYSQSVYPKEKEKIFLYENYRPKANKVFAGLNKVWKYTDMNGGDFPFILRQYKKAILKCGKEQLECEIQGGIRVKKIRNKYNKDVWGIKFRVKNVSSLKSLESESKSTAPMASPPIVPPVDIPVPPVPSTPSATKTTETGDDLSKLTDLF